MIDLHTHSTASDGEFSPTELIDLAIKKNIEALAITDHDTIDGLDEAQKYAQGKEILFIPGIEIKAKSEKGQMHILGLDIDYNNIDLQNKLNLLINKRNTRNNEFIKYFQNIGFDITLEELQKISRGGVIGKPHFAKLLMQKGYACNTESVFRNYFNCPPLSEIKDFIYNPEEVISMIKKANGIAILAHPQKLKLDDIELEKKVLELIKYGLCGLECYHSEQTIEEMKKLRALADKYQLWITKGSDYHGPVVKSTIQLGTGINGNIVNEEDEFILKKFLSRK